MQRLFAILLVSIGAAACGSQVSPSPAESSDAGGDGTKDCVEGGKTIANGETWTCACNTCGCTDGQIWSTVVECGCSDSTGFHKRGDTWLCPDGCNSCTCGADFKISSTLLACAEVDAGPAPDAGGSD